jgi:hypothetical protein
MVTDRTGRSSQIFINDDDKVMDAVSSHTFYWRKRNSF